MLEGIETDASQVETDWKITTIGTNLFWDRRKGFLSINHVFNWSKRWVNLN